MTRRLPGARQRPDRRPRRPPGCADLLLGLIEGCPFYIDARIYQSWDHPQLILDIAQGNPEGFSLGPGGRLHFVTRASACTAPKP
jgi:uncharacterized protein (DUF779 family)